MDTLRWDVKGGHSEMGGRGEHSEVGGRGEHSEVGGRGWTL